MEQVEEKVKDANVKLLRLTYYDFTWMMVGSKSPPSLYSIGYFKWSEIIIFKCQYFEYVDNYTFTSI